MEMQLRSKGQSLIEIVVSVGIIAVVLVGVSDLIIRSLGLSTYQAEKNVASNIAQNQLNYYRQIRDQRPTDFFDLSKNNPGGAYSACVGEYDTAKYGCAITYSGDGNGVEMKVVITWKNGENEIKTELSQTLAKPTK
jgi:type II secretory pathway pseudopilin PulG